MSVHQINNALSVVTMQLDNVDKVRQTIDQVDFLKLTTSELF